MSDPYYSRRFKDFKDKNTGCRGLYGLWDKVAKDAMKDVTLEQIYKKVYWSKNFQGVYNSLKLDDVPETELPSDAFPHHAASWKTKYLFMLELWEENSVLKAQQDRECSSLREELAKKNKELEDLRATAEILQTRADLLTRIVVRRGTLPADITPHLVEEDPSEIIAK